MNNAVKENIQSLIDAANAKTGKSDETLTEAVETLISGYESQDGQ